jgi:uncharacterized membrane protein YgdD (TMEM256/DUF423 family)
MWLAIGAISAASAVAAGAFGAHAFSTTLDPRAKEVFEVAVRYQMFHALGLLVVGSLAGRKASGAPKRLGLAGWCFLLGTVFFSGSLYGLALTNARWLGWITPAGGILFLVGWGSLAALALGRRR